MRSQRSPARSKALGAETPADAAFAPLDLRLPARASELRAARRHAHDAAAACGFDVDDQYEFMYAANEAVTNAIKHGRPDSDGTIGLRIAVDGDQLVLSVSDRGRFAAPRRAPDPMSEGGRGFAFMTELMDHVEVVSERGSTVVRLGKRLPVAGAPGDAHG